MFILEFLVIYVFPTILAMAAVYQIGKGIGHWLLNFFQASIYSISAALYVAIMIGWLNIIPMIFYFSITGISWLVAVCFEIWSRPANRKGEDKLSKWTGFVIPVLMIIHFGMYVVYLVLMAN